MKLAKRKWDLKDVRESDLYIVVDTGMTHAHGPYNSLQVAVQLAVAETRRSGQGHLPVAFDFTTGVRVTPEEIQEALQKGETEHDKPFEPRGYL